MLMKYLAYKIVEEVDRERFEKTINAMLQEGWEPYGGFFIVPKHAEGISDGLFQAMVRVRCDDDPPRSGGEAAQHATRPT